MPAPGALGADQLNGMNSGMAWTNSSLCHNEQTSYRENIEKDVAHIADVCRAAPNGSKTSEGSALVVFIFRG